MPPKKMNNHFLRNADFPVHLQLTAGKSDRNENLFRGGKLRSTNFLSLRSAHSSASVALLRCRSHCSVLHRSSSCTDPPPAGAGSASHNRAGRCLRMRIGDIAGQGLPARFPLKTGPRASFPGVTSLDTPRGSRLPPASPEFVP